MPLFMSHGVVIGNREPSWQPEEDRIVGQMLRQLLSFEGQSMVKNTLRSMESVVESAAQMADQIGARGDYVRQVGHQRLFVNGKSFEEQKDTVENMCSHCGNYTYGARFGHR